MFVASLCVLLNVAVAAPAAQWRDRVIYQVITDRFARTDNDNSTCETMFQEENSCIYGDYCGGTFDGLSTKLDDIKDMGFNAIWISPIVGNVGCGYTGYWAKDLYTISPEFGGEEGLRSLVAAAHARDIYVMVDVVFNHMGATKVNLGCSQKNYNYTNAFDDYRPFNRDSDYHRMNCTIDWSNATSVSDWWLFCLPDVNTESPKVVQLYLDWVNNMVKEFDIDGLRIDTIPYVPKKFWRTLTANITSNTFAMGEVNAGDCNDQFCPNVTWYSSYQEDADGSALNSILNYPVSEKMRPTFGMDCRTSTGKQVDFAPMTELQTRLQEVRGNFSDPSVLGNFVDSHDTARFLANRDDPVLLMNNMAFLFGMDGIPIVYYGTEDLVNTGAPDPRATAGYYDPANMNRWPLWMWDAPSGAEFFKSWLTRLIGFRRSTLHYGSSIMVDHFVEERTYSFLRGSALFVTFNVGHNFSSLQVANDMPVPSVWDSQAKVCDVLADTRECLNVVEFAQRFKGNAANSTWTSTGYPQIWVPDDTIFIL